MKENMTPEEIAAHSAGLFEGEGTIRIHRSTNRSNKYTYSLEVRVTNTNCIITDWFKQHYGGTVKTECHRDKPNWKLTLRWDLYSRNAEKFLQILHPYLRAKLPHVGVAFSFMCETNNEGKESRYQEMAVLNKRGN